MLIFGASTIDFLDPAVFRRFDAGVRGLMEVTRRPGGDCQCRHAWPTTSDLMLCGGMNPLTTLEKEPISKRAHLQSGARAEDRAYVLATSGLVVKFRRAAGGYGC